MSYQLVDLQNIGRNSLKPKYSQLLANSEILMNTVNDQSHEKQ